MNILGLHMADYAVLLVDILRLGVIDILYLTIAIQPEEIGQCRFRDGVTALTVLVGLIVGKVRLLGAFYEFLHVTLVVVQHDIVLQVLAQSVTGVMQTAHVLGSKPDSIELRKAQCQSTCCLTACLVIIGNQNHTFSIRLKCTERCFRQIGRLAVQPNGLETHAQTVDGIAASTNQNHRIDFLFVVCHKLTAQGIQSKHIVRRFFPDAAEAVTLVVVLRLIEFLE